METLQNSAYKIKAAPVPHVGHVLPEPGAICISEHDGNIYYADNYGWHTGGIPYTPIKFFVVFDGTNQFRFQFRAPITSNFSIHDGDGTVTDVTGNDLANVDHYTNYASAGTYFFYMVGDIMDMTLINVQNQTMIYGSINGWATITGLQFATMSGAVNLYGSINGFATNTANESILANNMPNLTGDISLFTDGTLTQFTMVSPGLTGDLSVLSNTVLSGLLAINLTNTTFSNTPNWDLSGTLAVILNDNKWSSDSVDNCLISLANGGTAGKSIDLGGNNATRTRRSDDALITLLIAGNTVTVNESFTSTSPVQFDVDYDGATQFNFTFQLPSTKYLLIYDGDGTRTLVQGNDAVDVVHTTNYAAAGKYSFHVEGDVLDLTKIDAGNMGMVSGNISEWPRIQGLIEANANNTKATGSIEGFGNHQNIQSLSFSQSRVSGRIENLAFAPALTFFAAASTNISGDVAKLFPNTQSYFYVLGNAVNFNSIVTWNLGGWLFAQDCSWSHNEVDNCLISLANGGTTGQTINIAGNNAPRTSASDAALATLQGAGNTVTVNE